MLIMIIAIPLLLAAYYSWTSKINQFFFFGRTVPEEFAVSKEAKTIQSRYRLEIWLGCVPAFGAGELVFRHNRFSAGVCALLIEVLVINLAFVRANRATTRLAPAVKASRAIEVPLAPPAKNPPARLALLVPLVIGIVILLAALLRVAPGSSLTGAAQALDALVASHGGENLLSFGMGLAFAGLLALLIRTTARIRTPLGQNALWCSLVATWAGVALMTLAIVSAFSGRMISGVESKILLATILLLALAVVLFRTLVQRRFLPPAAEMQADESWRWGLFYVNGNDPALFVQCRCDVGYTLNYGRAIAWPLSAVFLAFLIVALVAPGLR